MNQKLIQQARALGFVAVGFSRPVTPPFFDRFLAWVSTGKKGDMAWMGRHLDLRRAPKGLLDHCRTVITLAHPYSHEIPCTPEGLSAARYTEPLKTDYHERLKKKADRLAECIKQHHPETQTRVCVDSAPILERSFAYASGIGFIGKNNMLIIPGYGSYVFLAEILATARLSIPGQASMESLCGSCTRCIEACPTGALEGPYCLDASKCLSYLTIEKKGMVDKETGRKMGHCFFGCDICQEACPFNDGRAPKAVQLPSVKEILDMNHGTFREVFGKTAFSRAGVEKIKGNIMGLRNG